MPDETGLPTAVAVAEDAWAALTPRQRRRAAAAYACTPIHRCLHCGDAVDLRIDEASLQVTLCLDDDGWETGRINMWLCHGLCAPPQLQRMPAAQAARQGERWWGTSAGSSFWIVEPVESGGRTWPLLLVELAITDVIVDETPGPDGTYAARSRIIHRMHEGGFVVPSMTAPLADLPRIPGWEVLRSHEGRLQAVTCPPSRGAGSEAGVFVIAGEDNGTELSAPWQAAADARQEVLLLVVPPGTIGLPRSVSWDEDRDAAVRSAVHLLVLAMSQQPGAGTLGQVPLLAAVRDGRIAAGRVPVRTGPSSPGGPAAG